VTHRRGPGRAVISRDTFSFLGGWYLIIYQAQFAAEFNQSVFIGGILIACVPGGLAAWATRAPPTDPPSSDSQPAVSSVRESS
jgi:hypothetical protein